MQVFSSDGDWELLKLFALHVVVFSLSLLCAKDSIYSFNLFLAILVVSVNPNILCLFFCFVDIFRAGSQRASIRDWSWKIEAKWISLITPVISMSFSSSNGVNFNSSVCRGYSCENWILCLVAIIVEILLQISFTFPLIFPILYIYSINVLHCCSF